MFTNTIRRSAATLGVVAGLLAAAVPASAAGVPSTVSADALGTQVGSEGLTAPANADEQTKGTVKAVVVLIGANDYGFTEGNSPAPLGITLCHEGFEIQ